MAKKVKDSNKKSLLTEFKEFITRGSVLDMAVGVIIGGAFSAIVTAVVSILMSLCTWAVPGGIAGLVTVLKPFPGSAQGGITGIGQTFAASSEGVAQAVEAYANSMLPEGSTYNAETMFAQYWTLLQTMYTKHGGTYVYNMAACIDWGTLINAVISFLIVALTLFIVVKVAAKAKEARLALKAKIQEEYWVKHPEERPVPVEPGTPEPTDHEILKEMLEVLKAKKAVK